MVNTKGHGIETCYRDQSSDEKHMVLWIFYGETGDKRVTWKTTPVIKHTFILLF